MSTLKDILALRGRIVVFTATHDIGLRVEKTAELNHAFVVCTRGWADKYGPLYTWTRLNQCREYGLLSCDQRTYLQGIQLQGTDYVWVGNCFDTPEVMARYQKVQQMAMDYEARLWTIAESDV